MDRLPEKFECKLPHQEIVLSKSCLSSQYDESRKIQKGISKEEAHELEWMAVGEPIGKFYVL